jgi:hypothetical protein
MEESKDELEKIKTTVEDKLSYISSKVQDFKEL